MDSGIVALQERIAHQEAAIDELTRQSLAQADQVRLLLERIKRLEDQLRDLSQRVGQEVVDAPPPHY